MADIGIGSLYAGRIGKGNGPGYYDVEFRGEAAANPGKKGFEVGSDGGSVAQGSFLKLQYYKPG
jgi:hypothetical protein